MVVSRAEFSLTLTTSEARKLIEQSDFELTIKRLLIDLKISYGNSLDGLSYLDVLRSIDRLPDGQELLMTLLKAECQKRRRS